MIYMLTYFVVLTIVIFIIDILQKRVFTSKQWGRTATHIITGLIVATFPFYLNVNQIIGLSFIFTVILAISKAKNILSLHNIVRKSYGEVLFPVSIGLVAIITLPAHSNAYYAAILSLALADAGANIFGSFLPIKRVTIARQSKSIGGFICFIILMMAILFALYGLNEVNFGIILAIAIFIGFVELISVYGYDNLTVPVFTALLSTFVEINFQV